MSFYIPDYEIDNIIEEDVNPVDLTSFILGMDRFSAKISYFGRTAITVCCTEDVERICRKLDISVKVCVASGTDVKAGDVFFSAEGRADMIHMLWRNGTRMFESFCGVSTRTSEFVRKAQSYNPNVNIVTTRKCMPGTKKLVTKAVMAGGAIPHRLGLSETVLIFDPHIELFGGMKKILENMIRIRTLSKEKKIGIEVHDMNSALEFVMAGFDFIQLDKFSAEDVSEFCSAAKKINPAVTVCAAGNVTIDNVSEYASSGVDVIVTSSLYFGPPADIKAVIEKN